MIQADKIKSPFSSLQREKLLSLSNIAKENNYLSPSDRKILYEGGYYNFIFINRLKSLYEALEQLSDKIPEEDFSEISHLAFNSYLKVRSQEGDEEAQYLLGLAYYHGFQGLDVDLDKGFSLLIQSSNQGNIEAKVELGRISLVEENPENGMKYLQDAIVKGSLEALHLLALGFMHEQIPGRNYKDAISILEESADAGEPVSIRMIGEIYYDFVEETGSEEKAISLWRTSAEAGDEKAMRLLGMHYLFHEEDTYNDEAYEWLKKAADELEPIACYRTGERYYKGLGAEVDYDEAYHYFLLGAICEDVDAMAYLGKCYFFGYGTEEDDDSAFYYFEKAALLGNASSLFYLGICYREGVGVDVDSEEAFNLLKIAAEEQVVSAYIYLGEMYQDGEGTEKNFQKAFEYFLEAARYNDPRALFAVGNAYYEGAGVKENDIEAVKWLTLAANTQHAEASYLLGECYLKGFGVDEDFEKALQLLSYAKQEGVDGAEDLLREFELEDECSNNDKNSTDETALFNPIEAKARHLYEEITDSLGQQSKEPKFDNIIYLEDKFQERMNAKLHEES